MTYQIAKPLMCNFMPYTRYKLDQNITLYSDNIECASNNTTTFFRPILYWYKFCLPYASTYTILRFAYDTI